MKKKIVTCSLVVALLVIGVIGASLAYFTDTDKADNVFTTGKVNITLNENFDEDNAKLLPGSSTKNNIQKEVWIKNESDSEDAYVWYEWLIPAALDSTDGSTGTNNIIQALPLEKTWDHTLTGTVQGFVGTETVDGIVYNKYVALYHGKLAPNAETTVAMSQVYMDSKVDTNNNGQYTINGNVIDYDFSKGVHIIVRAYGIQAAGFDDVYAAYKAYNN